MDHNPTVHRYTVTDKHGTPLRACDDILDALTAAKLIAPSKVVRTSDRALLATYGTRTGESRGSRRVRIRGQVQR